MCMQPTLDESDLDQTRSQLLSQVALLQATWAAQAEEQTKQKQLEAAAVRSPSLGMPDAWIGNR